MILFKLNSEGHPSNGNNLANLTGAKLSEEEHREVYGSVMESVAPIVRALVCDNGGARPEAAQIAMRFPSSPLLDHAAPKVVIGPHIDGMKGPTNNVRPSHSPRMHTHIITLLAGAAFQRVQRSHRSGTH